jgi:general secretion pathway protein G
MGANVKIVAASGAAVFSEGGILMLLRQQQPKRQTKRRGFTLMEIIVVVAIILILASAGVVAYTTMLAGAKEDRAKLDCKSLDQAVGVYFAKHGQYPASLQELAQRQPDGSPSILKSEKALIDPWGNAYIYDQGSRHQTNDTPLIYSNGPPGLNKRISNWD